MVAYPAVALDHVPDIIRLEFRLIRVIITRFGPDSDFLLSGSGQILGILKTGYPVSGRIVKKSREK